MKRKLIPALITLTAGFIACIAGILAHMETTDFMIMLLVVLILFYILGSIIKIVVDIGFKEMQTEEDGESEEIDGETVEGIEEEGEEEAGQQEE